MPARPAIHVQPSPASLAHLAALPTRWCAPATPDITATGPFAARAHRAVQARVPAPLGTTDTAPCALHARRAMRLLAKSAHAQPAVAPTWCSARAMLGTTGQGLCARLAKPVMRNRRRPERVLLAR